MFSFKIKLHLVCASIKDAWYKIFSENPNILWICDACKNSATTTGQVMINKENECLKREKGLMQKLLNEMKYSNNLQKNIINALEEKLNINKNYINMESSNRPSNSQGHMFRNTVENSISNQDNKQTSMKEQTSYANKAYVTAKE